MGSPSNGGGPVVSTRKPGPSPLVNCTRFVYASLQNEVGHPEVWVMNADGSDQTRLTFTPPSPSGPTWGIHASWAPDGERMVFASTSSGSSQIWMMNADGSNPVQLTNGNGPGFPNCSSNPDQNAMVVPSRDHLEALLSGKPGPFPLVYCTGLLPSAVIIQI